MKQARKLPRALGYSPAAAYSPGVRVYLDHLSTTPILPEAEEAMRPFLATHFGSPSSPHQEGHAARQALARAREQCAALIRAEAPDNILFTGEPPKR
jgi:cysteine desulfurase